MPSLYITEYSTEGVDALGKTMPAAVEPSITTQKVTIGATSAQSAVLNAQTTLVRLHTDAACHVLFASDPTATTSSMRIAADGTEYMAVRSGGSVKVAVIAG
jgi:hypothetical protein